MGQSDSQQARICSGGSFQLPRKTLNTSTRQSKLLQQCGCYNREKKGRGKQGVHVNLGMKTRVKTPMHLDEGGAMLRMLPLSMTLLQMVASGMYKCDNGFKPGYLNHLEKALKITCLNSGIKARPHIESRQKCLNKEWFIINDMICGIRHGTSGLALTRLLIWSLLPMMYGKIT
ncbi:hypothetical protein Syun_001584 [Stephania yunnanensis]|uniref:Uncharacterized protein n=1 Tax=Stephania yunnanensis TaxID=152371 RepID=A0AAP0LJQ0_9MAGN